MTKKEMITMSIPESTWRKIVDMKLNDRKKFKNYAKVIDFLMDFYEKNKLKENKK